MNKTLLGIILFIGGSLLLINWAGVINLPPDLIIGGSISLFGLLSINFSLRTNNRKMIAVSVISFLVGIIFLIKGHFEIFNTQGLVFVSILFIIGAVLLLFFINSREEKVFLYSAILLITLSYVSITFLRPAGFFELTARIDSLFSSVWPVLLMLFGIVLFLSRKN